MEVSEIYKDLTSRKNLFSLLGVYYLCFSIPLILLNDPFYLILYGFFSFSFVSYLVISRYSLGLDPVTSLMNAVQEIKSNPGHKEFKRSMKVFMLMGLLFLSMDALTYFTSSPETVAATDPSLSPMESAKNTGVLDEILDVALVVFVIAILIVAIIASSAYAIVNFAYGLTFPLNSMLNGNAIEKGKVYKHSDVIKIIMDSNKFGNKGLIGLFFILAAANLSLLYVHAGIFYFVIVFPLFLYSNSVVIKEMELGKHQKQEDESEDFNGEVALSKF